MLDKYLFQPGDVLPAVNVDSIDPDNIYNQTAGYLTGGTNVSALSIFQTLADGSNDGKFSTNIDGIQRNDIYVSLRSHKIESLSYVKAKTYSGRIIRFSTDGTKMLVKAHTHYSVTTYSLSTPWDISTATSWKNQSFESYNYPAHFDISPDGTKLFFIAPTGSSNTMNLYKTTLSTPWDVTTFGTVSSVSTGQIGSGHGELRLSDDGMWVFVGYYPGSNPARIRVFALPSAWDISSISLSETVNLDSDFNSETPIISFSDNGNMVSIARGGYNLVKRYILPQPYKLTLDNLFSSGNVPEGYQGDPSIYGMTIHNNRLFISRSYNNAYHILEYLFGPVYDYNDIAYSVESAIRAATGSMETVVYNVDHFKITSATLRRSSKILKLTTPSTGTDISGAGDVPYLDMADNATETQGTGEEYRLVRIGSDNLLPVAILPKATIVASDTLQGFANTERTETGTAYTKKKEILIARTGVIRVKFDLKSSSSTICYGRVYKNGSAIGTERSQGPSYATYTEDISVVAGELIQLYAKASAGQTCYVKNFQICYTELINTVNTD